MRSATANNENPQKIRKIPQVIDTNRSDTRERSKKVA